MVVLCLRTPCERPPAPGVRRADGHAPAVRLAAAEPNDRDPCARARRSELAASAETTAGSRTLAAGCDTVDGRWTGIPTLERVSRRDDEISRERPKRDEIEWEHDCAPPATSFRATSRNP